MVHHGFPPRLVLLVVVGPSRGKRSSTTIDAVDGPAHRIVHATVDALQRSCRRPARSTDGRRAGGQRDVARARARRSGCSMRCDQQAHRLEAQRLDRLVDGGERRMGERRLRDVVESDHRQVVGHREAEFGGGAHGLDRRQVVGGEDRGRPIGEREQVAGGRLGGRLVKPPSSTSSGSNAMPASSSAGAVALLAAVAPTRGRGDRRGSRSADARARSGAVSRRERAFEVLRRERGNAEAPTCGSTATTGLPSATWDGRA